MVTGAEILTLEPELAQTPSLKSYQAALEEFGKTISEKQKCLPALSVLFAAKPALWSTLSELALEIVSNNKSCIILSEGLIEELIRASLSMLKPFGPACASCDLKLVGSNLGNEFLKQLCLEITDQPVSLYVLFYDRPSPRLLWCYRLLYSALAVNRSQAELKRRVILAAGETASQWASWAKASGFRTLAFPLGCDGRYLFFSQPIALILELAGFTAWQCVEGGRSFMRGHDKKGGFSDPVLAYSALREMQLTDGLKESLDIPDQSFQGFARWWKAIGEDSRQAFSEAHSIASITSEAVVMKAIAPGERQWVTRIRSEAEKDLHALALAADAMPPWPKASKRSWGPLEEHYEKLLEAQYTGPNYGHPCPLLKLRRQDPSSIGALFAFFEASVSTCHRLADIGAEFRFVQTRELEGEPGMIR